MCPNLLTFLCGVCVTFLFNCHFLTYIQRFSYFWLQVFLKQHLTNVVIDPHFSSEGLASLLWTPNKVAWMYQSYYCSNAYQDVISTTFYYTIDRFKTHFTQLIGSSLTSLLIGRSAAYELLIVSLTLLGPLLYYF